MANDKKTAGSTASNAGIGEGVKVIPGIDLSQFSEREQTGFAPYFFVNEEDIPSSQFVARVVGLDTRPADFARYLFQASHATECHEGPQKEGKQVQVKPGEIFSLSVFHGLDERLREYLDCAFDTGKFIELHLKALEKRDTKKAGQKVWKWEISVKPDTKKMLTEWRQANGRNPMVPGLPAAQQQREQLDENNS